MVELVVKSISASKQNAMNAMNEIFKTIVESRQNDIYLIHVLFNLGLELDEENLGRIDVEHGPYEILDLEQAKVVSLMGHFNEGALANLDFSDLSRTVFHPDLTMYPSLEKYLSSD